PNSDRNPTRTAPATEGDVAGAGWLLLALPVGNQEEAPRSERVSLGWWQGVQHPRLCGSRPLRHVRTTKRSPVRRCPVTETPNDCIPSATRPIRSSVAL